MTNPGIGRIVIAVVLGLIATILSSLLMKSYRRYVSKKYDVNYDNMKKYHDVEERKGEKKSLLKEVDYGRVYKENIESI